MTVSCGFSTGAFALSCAVVKMVIVFPHNHIFSKRLHATVRVASKFIVFVSFFAFSAFVLAFQHFPLITACTFQD